MKTVLVTEGWLWGTLPVLRSLKQHGLRVLLLTCPQWRQGAGSSRCCDAVFFGPDVQADESGLVQRIRELVDREKVDVILPLVDPLVEVLSDHRQALDSEVALAVPPKGAVDVACDKSKTLMALEDLIPGLGPAFSARLGHRAGRARLGASRDSALT